MVWQDLFVWGVIIGVVVIFIRKIYQIAKEGI